MKLVRRSQTLNPIQHIKVIGKPIEMAAFTVSILPKIEIANRSRDIALLCSFYTRAFIHFAHGCRVAATRKNPAAKRYQFLRKSREDPGSLHKDPRFLEPLGRRRLG